MQPHVSIQHLSTYKHLYTKTYSMSCGNIFFYKYIIFVNLSVCPSLLAVPSRHHGAPGGVDGSWWGLSYD